MKSTKGHDGLPAAPGKLQVLEPGQAVDIWQRGAIHINAEYEHFHLVCRLRPQVIRPYAIHVEGGSLSPDDFLLVGRLETQEAWSRLGYWRLASLPVKAWVGVHGGWIGRPSDAQVQAALEHIGSLLSRRVIDMAVIHGIRQDLAGTETLMQWVNAWRIHYVTPWTPHYILHLEDDPEFLWKRLRSKHRSWLRGREKRLKEQFGESLHWRWYREFPNLKELMARLEVLAAKTYQRSIGAGFRNDGEHRERFRLFAERGVLRIQTLEAQDRILAFWIGELADGTFYSAETGYDAVLRQYMPGNLVFFRMVEHLAKEGARQLDFGQGDAEYKQRFASDLFLERDVFMFSSSVRGLAAAFLIGGLGRLHESGKTWMARHEFLDRIRTAWRRRLRGSDGEAEE